VTTDSKDCAEVLLDLPTRIANSTLTYRIPEVFRGVVGIGVRTLVPLGPGTAQGYVIEVHPCAQSTDHQIREILEVSDPEPLFSPSLASLARWMANETLSTLREAVRCLIPPEIARRRVRKRVDVAAHSPAFRSILVADGPEDRPALGIAGDDRPTLVWGDAGARLAWIAKAAQTVVQRGGQVLVVVPEIAHTPALVDRLRAALGDRVAAYHSGLPTRQRRALWQQIRAGEVDVVVGARSALFAPLNRLCLIVVDEEQDPSLKADSAPRYHGRDVALHRATQERVRVVLSTPTPSLETYAATLSGRLTCLRLPPVDPAPAVTVVDMRTGRSPGRSGTLSLLLVDAIRRHLRAGGSVALFVNRVGYARVLLCQECGHAVRCRRCDVTMPYDRERGTIHCRVCGDARPAPEVCPRCKGVALRWVGPGTKRVEEVARRLFPALRIARVDRETASSFASVAQAFTLGRVRLVVGTQLLLRARQIRPSLIGVVDADHPLHLPDFRAAERAFHLMRAVVSLAGPAPGPEAVVQTRVPDHPALVAIRTGEDERLYQSELAVRREFGYPPYASLARIVASSPDRAVAYGLAEQVAKVARACGVDVLGPAPSIGAGKRVQAHVLLRSPEPAAVRNAAHEALVQASRGRRDRLTVEIDPQEISAW
jgi:primosomal protein N' (replication factor Y)